MFLFSIFNGFFISRQASRYNDIRNTLSKIDADFSTIWRHANNCSKSFTEKVREVILDYYKNRAKSIEDYINKKSTTIMDFHRILKTKMSEQLVGLESESVKKILNVTDDIQIQRKLLIALSQEKVSHYQYAIVFILAVILLTNLVLIDSYQLKVESVMKAVFVSIIFVVIWTLNRFDNLKIFHGEIGADTGKDVVDIIKGKK
jgi:hypothetical protein